MAIALEIVANGLMKVSDGFMRMLLAVLAMVCALTTFSALSYAMKD
jgi:multidrug transporter EmrE-like cation transporter